MVEGMIVIKRHGKFILFEDIRLALLAHYPQRC